MIHSFITIYGINNLGKTTQADLLVKKLNDIGQPAIHLKYPRYDIEPSGPYIDKILRQGLKTSTQKEVEMWMSINRYQAEAELKAKLEQSIVVSEDYVGTGIAWGVANGATKAWMEQINKHLLKEDLAMLLDGERFTEAVETGHVHETNDELVKKCRQVHLELANKYNWPIIKANDSIETVHGNVWNVVNEKFNFEKK